MIIRDVDGVYVYSVDFGLERYFVPENTGKELEDLSSERTIDAHLKVKNGYGILQKISAVK